jgi:hypothetical protein
MHQPKFGIRSAKSLPKPLSRAPKNMLPDRQRPAVAGHRRDIDDLLAAELARGRTLQAAAQAVGCGERTARRRWADLEFKAKVAAIRAELIDRTTGILAENLNLATNTLRELLTDADSRVRLTAAVKLLELAVKYHDATKPATPPHEGHVIEYVHRVITTESKLDSPATSTTALPGRHTNSPCALH